MKRQIYIWIIAIAVILSLDSCTHYYYFPNQHNVPLFKEKNEVRVSGAVINGDEVTGCNVQAAYAMTKESAIMANALVINPTSHDGRGQLYELGAGYYKPLADPSALINKKFVFESYAVIGLGSATNYYNNYPYGLSTNIFKAYLQPSIGYTSNLFDLIVSAKIGAIHTFGIRKNMPDTTYNDLLQNGSTIGTDLNTLQQSRTAFVFEPAFTVRLGFKYAKLHFQVGTTVVSDHLSVLTPMGKPVINCGITIAIARRFWQKDERPKKDRWKQLFD